MKKKFIFFIFVLFFLFSLVHSVFAQEIQNPEETLEGVVTDIVEKKQIMPLGSDTLQPYQKLKVEITKGSLRGDIILIENGVFASANTIEYKTNDKLIISYTKKSDGQNQFLITDFVRRGSLALLFIIFVIFTALIGRLQGLSSLLGMGISFLVIFKLVLPQIASGRDPVVTAIIGSLFIIPATFLLSHGVNKKTFIAIFGTLISLIITGFMANFFVNTAKLTGFASEEAGFLQSFGLGNINIKGLLLAGIIIGVLGVLDDITISQSSIVTQLKKANPKLGMVELYKKAMAVGRDHIASMVNTLVLVYTGASLPLLLIFINNPHPFMEIINYEIIADEIVRTLTGSIGLILAVPITTAIAALASDEKIGIY